MRLLVVRHGIAAPGGGAGDHARMLTPEGTRRFTAAAQRLAALLPRPDVLLTSPLLRARQTAALAAAAWGDVTPTVEPALASGSVNAIFDALERHGDAALIALVGHEPTVSVLVAELLGMRSPHAVAFEPGAAALLDVTSLAARSGCLAWFVPAAAAVTLAGGSGPS